MADEIIQEVWRIKSEIARRHGNDLASRYSELREQTQARGQKTVNLREAKLRPVSKPDSTGDA